MILDGGSGLLSVTFVPDALSFVGPDEPEALERVLGVRIDLVGLVGALLNETSETAGVRIARTAAIAPALPDRLELETADARLELELRRLRPLAADPARLGVGHVPEGNRVRPLAELPSQAGRVDELTAGETEP